MSNLPIETQHLNFGFKKNNLIIKDINLQVEQGSIYGFLGPNGAGKTTTIRLLLGLLTPQQGEIKIFGKNLLKIRYKFIQIRGINRKPFIIPTSHGFRQS